MYRSFAPSRVAHVAGLAALLCFASVRADEVADINKLFRGGQLPAALAKVDVALTQHPKDAQLRFMKGMIVSEQGKSAEAIAIFQKLTEDYPELPEPYNNLAVLYAAAGQYDKARVALERAIRTSPAYATAHENLGDVYAKLASQSYDKAMQLLDTPPPSQAPKSKLAMVRTLKGPGAQPASVPTPVPLPATAAIASTASAARAPAASPVVPPAQPAPAAPSAPAAPVARAAKPATQPAPAATVAPTMAARTPAPAATPAPANPALAAAVPAKAAAPVVAAAAPAPVVARPAAPAAQTPASNAAANVAANRPAAPAQAAVSGPARPELVHVKPGAPAAVAPAPAAPAAAAAKASATTAPAPAVQLAKAEPTKNGASDKAEKAEKADASKADINKAVDQWAKAWSAQDMKGYLNAYGANFQPPRGQSRQAWAAERSARIEGKEHIKVSVESPQITISGSTATVKFRQIYVSDRLKANSRKTLVMEKQGNKWVIKQEQSGG